MMFPFDVFKVKQPVIVCVGYSLEVCVNVCLCVYQRDREKLIESETESSFVRE